MKNWGTRGQINCSKITELINGGSERHAPTSRLPRLQKANSVLHYTAPESVEDISLWVRCYATFKKSASLGHLCKGSWCVYQNKSDHASITKCLQSLVGITQQTSASCWRVLISAENQLSRSSHMAPTWVHGISGQQWLELPLGISFLSLQGLGRKSTALKDEVPVPALSSTHMGLGQTTPFLSCSVLTYQMTWLHDCPSRSKPVYLMNLPRNVSYKEHEPGLHWHPQKDMETSLNVMWGKAVCGTSQTQRFAWKAGSGRWLANLTEWGQRFTATPRPLERLGVFLLVFTPNKKQFPLF